jgi:hypothetical protein
MHVACAGLDSEKQCLRRGLKNARAQDSEEWRRIYFGGGLEAARIEMRVSSKKERRKTGNPNGHRKEKGSR